MSHHSISPNRTTAYRLHRATSSSVPGGRDARRLSTAQPRQRCRFGPTGCTHSLIDTSFRALKEHFEIDHSAMLSRTDDGKYQCHWQLGAGHECNASLSGINGLVKHTRQVHLRTEEVRCNHCGAAFSRPDARERHIQKSCKERPAVMQGESRRSQR